MPVRRLRSRWVGRAILSLLLACGWLATLWAAPARAAGTTYTVSDVWNEISPNECTLYNAIVAAETNAPYGGCPAGSSTEEDVINLVCDSFACSTSIFVKPDDPWSSFFRPITAAGGPLRIRFVNYSVGTDLSQPPYVPLFEVDGGTVTFENVTINSDDACIYAHDGASITIIGSLLYECGFGLGYADLDDEGGAIRAIDSTVIVSNSTFQRNGATEGGAIYLSGGSLTVTNTTFSRNFSITGGSAIYLTNGATANLSFVTVADGEDWGTPGDGPAFAVGGATATGVLRLKNTVLADPAINECENDPGLTVQKAGAVLADDASCGSGVSVVPNLRSTLGNLAYNNAPTPTHALLNGSPAIAAVPSGQCTDWANNPVTQDQRGQPRPNPSGTPCDAGAYESELGSSATPTPTPPPTPTPTPTPVPKPDLVVRTLDARSRAARGGPLRATITVANQGTAPAPASTVALLFSADPTPSADDALLGTCSVGALGVGQQASCQVTVRAVPRTPHQQGYLVAMADWGNGVVELNETNNSLAQPFLIQ